MSQRLVVGVDLGGTNVRALLIDESGAEAGPRIEAPSRAREGAAACIEAISAAILEAVGDSKPESIGLAIPGHIEGGVVRWAPNFGEFVNGEFRSWRDVQIGAPLREKTGLPVYMANDANLAALGEYRFGSGMGNACAFVLFTLGTGIGGGVVLGPESLHPVGMRAAMLIGGNGGGGELGHTIVEANGRICSCGARGCLEAYCGTPGLIATAKAMMSTDTDFTPKDLFHAAERDEPLAAAIWRSYGMYLGIGIGNAINVFAPQIVAIGGQVARAAKWFLPHAEEVARSNAIPSLVDGVRIVVAEQIDDAGILGAAALALEAAR